MTMRGAIDRIQDKAMPIATIRWYAVADNLAQVIDLAQGHVGPAIVVKENRICLAILPENVLAVHSDRSLRRDLMILSIVHCRAK